MEPAQRNRAEQREGRRQEVGVKDEKVG